LSTGIFHSESWSTLSTPFVIPTHGPRFSDPFFNDLLASTESKAAEQEFDLLVSTCASVPEELKGYERMVLWGGWIAYWQSTPIPR